jgi:hypothetical protein
LFGIRGNGSTHREDRPELTDYTDKNADNT